MPTSASTQPPASPPSPLRRLLACIVGGESARRSREPECPEPAGGQGDAVAEEGPLQVAGHCPCGRKRSAAMTPPNDWGLGERYLTARCENCGTNLGFPVRPRRMARGGYWADI